MHPSANIAETVIQRFGGLTALATALGHENPTTVQGWKERGRIPYFQWPAIERAAKAEGLKEITCEALALAHAKQASAQAGAA